MIGQNSERTTNYCEAWNRRFETLVGHKSPSVWTTLEVLGYDAAEAATMLVRHSTDVHGNGEDWDPAADLGMVCSARV